MTEPDDFDLFRAETKGIKPIKQDTFVAPRQKSGQKKSHEPLLNEHDGVIKYLREGEDSHLLKQLRRGDFSPELFLDLHGLTREQAKMELAALLLACEDEHVYCASIMTGYGTFTLKKQIPRWLVQHPKVRALHQAPKEWGGEAAILILVDV